MLGWGKKRRREEVVAAPVPDAWLEAIRPWALFDELDDDEQAQLLDIVKVLLAEKNWEGCGGLELTEPMRAVIAAQAALLVLEIPHDFYEESDSVLVYPTDYVVPHAVHRGGGIMSEGEVRSGEAWYRGPVILSWERVEQGFTDPEAITNVVLHEFAHRLDMLSGVQNGTPPLERRVEPKEWAAVMKRAFDTLCKAVESDQETLIDPYGASNEVEFFAVVTETFFIEGNALEEDDRDLYDILRAYYQQDPAARYRAAWGS
ncbi:MAG: zinc-dependent peptidase [Planctomycetota bacterium]|nr:zinc-dependent peptidase [Planctomycetota bacterium]